MIPAAPESTNAVPFDNVKVCPASVYTGTSSTVALNYNFKGAVVANSCASVRIELPSLRNNPTVCTGLESVPAFEPFNDIPFAPTLLPCGSVAPLAAISRFPDPSDFMVAPPRSIVSAATYTVCHLLVTLPNWKTPV